MLEIRWHGRGGQGVWSASAVLASAAINTGKYAQSFPQFGPERTGAPVLAFNRIDDRPIVVHSMIYEPDIVVVIDRTLLSDREAILGGLRPGGHLIADTDESPEELRARLQVHDSIHVWTLDAVTLALEEVGRAFTNTPMLGAVIKAAGVVPLEAIEESIKERWKGEIGEKNVKAVRRAFNEVAHSPAKVEVTA